jgi:hypothetical protein
MPGGKQQADLEGVQSTQQLPVIKVQVPGGKEQADLEGVQSIL